MTGTVDPSTTRADQPRAPARDQHVDQAARGHEVLHRLVRRARHERDRVGRAGPARDERVAHHRRRARRWSRTPTRLPRSSAALPLLRHEHRGVDGDVGPGLVDHADDAERHAQLAHLRGRWAACSRGRPRRPGRAARRRRARASAIACSRSGVRVSRSTIAGSVPFATARVDVAPRWPRRCGRSRRRGRRRSRAARRPSRRGAARAGSTAASRPRRATSRTASRSSAVLGGAASSTAVSVTGTSVERAVKRFLSSLMKPTAAIL